jgi:hypothetical protein
MDILAVSISALIGMGIIIIVSSSLLFLFLVSLFVKKLKKDLLNNIAELINKSNTLTETSSDSFSNIENTISFSQVKKQNINLDIKSIYTETQEILIQIKKYVDYMDSLKESLTVNPNNLAIYQNQKDSLPLIESYYNQNESLLSISNKDTNNKDNDVSKSNISQNQEQNQTEQLAIENAHHDLQITDLHNNTEHKQLISAKDIADINNNRITNYIPNNPKEQLNNITQEKSNNLNESQVFQNIASYLSEDIVTLQTQNSSSGEITILNDSKAPKDPTINLIINNTDLKNDKTNIIQKVENKKHDFQKQESHLIKNPYKDCNQDAPKQQDENKVNVYKRYLNNPIKNSSIQTQLSPQNNDLNTANNPINQTNNPINKINSIISPSQETQKQNFVNKSDSLDNSIYKTSIKPSYDINNQTGSKVNINRLNQFYSKYGNNQSSSPQSVSGNGIKQVSSPVNRINSSERIKYTPLKTSPNFTSSNFNGKSLSRDYSKENLNRVASSVNNTDTKKSLYILPNQNLKTPKSIKEGREISSRIQTLKIIKNN